MSSSLGAQRYGGRSCLRVSRGTPCRVLREPFCAVLDPLEAILEAFLRVIFSKNVGHLEHQLGDVPVRSRKTAMGVVSGGPDLSGKIGWLNVWWLRPLRCRISTCDPYLDISDLTNLHVKAASGARSCIRPSLGDGVRGARRESFCAVLDPVEAAMAVFLTVILTINFGTWLQS